MREQKESCPGWCEHPGQQMELSGFDEPITSASNCITNPRRISRLLNHGQRYAIRLKELKAMTGLDERAVRLLIQRERLDGVPILADCKSGYFLPMDETEKTICVRSMLRRAEEIRRVAEAINRADIERG